MKKKGFGFSEFTRSQWSQYRGNDSLVLTQKEIERLRGQIEPLDTQEAQEIFLPLTRYLNIAIENKQRLLAQTADFFGQPLKPEPFIIGIAGSVAVGKSTTSRLLKAIFSTYHKPRRVEIVTTDGFLYPNHTLKKKRLMQKKGFPESYDLNSLIQFMYDVKNGKKEIRIPLYSHQIYDIVPEQYQTVSQPEILILEGINVLQVKALPEKKSPTLFVSDYFDFSLYVDAETSVIKQWFLKRFHLLRKKALSDPGTFFYQFAKWDKARASTFAANVWDRINQKNLIKNILPYRERANLILHKNKTHAVDRIYFRNR